MKYHFLYTLVFFFLAVVLVIPGTICFVVYQLFRFLSLIVLEISRKDPAGRPAKDRSFFDSRFFDRGFNVLFNDDKKKAS